MHIGNFLKDVLKRKRYNMSQIAEKVNKSPAGVKKDLEKDKLSMAVLETYADVLDINIYALLANEWNKTHDHQEQEAPVATEIKKSATLKKLVEKADEEIYVTINLRGKKKDSILKILLED
jgi:transcriptional regulator with XRE-family HTH domain